MQIDMANLEAYPKLKSFKKKSSLAFRFKEDLKKKKKKESVLLIMREVGCLFYPVIIRQSKM